MVLAIVTSIPPSKVTLNEYGYHLVKHFRQHKNVEEIVLLTDKTTKEKELSFSEAGCKVTVKECWEFNSYKNIFTISNAIETTKPDAVFFNLQFMKFGDKKIPAALGLLLPFICKIKRIPNIVLLHNILEQVDLKSAGFTSNKWLQKAYNVIGTTLTKFILQADIVAVTMQKYVTSLEEKYLAKNVTMVPHGTFELSAEEPKHNLPKGPLKVMTFGKFGTYKKVEGLIEAVDQLRKERNLELEIVIAGTDNPNVPGYLQKVKEQYKHIKNITFTGYIDEKDVPTIFNESAVVVFPYTSTTGSSGVLHQAGSYGKAVVMPNLGDLKTLIEDEGYRGEYFEPTNVNSLAKAIERIVTNEQYRIALGNANYEAANAFPMSKIVDIYVQKFNNLIANKATELILKRQKVAIEQ